MTRLRTFLAGLARRAGWVQPAVPWREAAARAAIGMPARHPERITRSLRRGQERWLAATAARLWPGVEYAQIIRDTRQGGQP